MVRVREPQDRNTGPPVAEDLRAKSLGHGPVPGAVATDIERVHTADGLAARPKGTGAMIDETKAVRIEKVRSSGRHIRERNEPTRIGDALGKRRHAQCRAGRGSHMS